MKDKVTPLRIEDPMLAVRKYFTVETAPHNRDMWLIICEKCANMWHLKKGNETVGSVLHLLNHARGHKS
jgi:hypothetical protein